MNAHKQIHNAPCAPQVMAQLFFGTSAAGRPMLGPLDFEDFLADSVTPRFSGFTLQMCMGYWKGEAEECRVLTILMEDSDSGRASIRTIAEHYKSRFNQEAVAYSFTPCQFSLNCWPFGPVAKYHELDKGTAIRAPEPAEGFSVYESADGWEIVKDSNGAILATVETKAEAIVRSFDFATQYEPEPAIA